MYLKKRRSCGSHRAWTCLSLPTCKTMSLWLELTGVGGLCSRSHMQRDAVDVILLFLDTVVGVGSVCAHRVTEPLLGLRATMGHVHRSTGSRLGEAKLLWCSVLPGSHLGRPAAVCLQRTIPFGRVWESSSGKGQVRGQGCVAWQSEGSRESSLVSGRGKDAHGAAECGGWGGSHA